jgi:N4-gp56 family major capsid protein
MYIAGGTAGGFLVPEIWDRELRNAAQPLIRFRQFARQVAGLEGGGRGDIIHVQKVANVTTAGTTLTAGTTVPKTGMAISTVTYQVEEWGNGIAYEGRLEDLASHDTIAMYTKALGDDAAKVLDIGLRNVIIAGHGATASGIFVQGSAGNAPGTIKPGSSVNTACGPLNATTVWAAVDYLLNANAPTVDGNNYIGLIHPYAARGIKKDANFVNAALYAGATRIFNGEIGMWERVRWIETTQCVVDTTNPLTSYTTHIFGRDAFGEARAFNLGIRADTPVDFGRQKALGWFWDGDFVLEYWQYSALLYSLAG